jgi:hypothetical protein
LIAAGQVRQVQVHVQSLYAYTSFSHLVRAQSMTLRRQCQWLGTAKERYEEKVFGEVVPRHGAAERLSHREPNELGADR